MCLSMKLSKMSSVKDHEVSRDASEASRCSAQRLSVLFREDTGTAEAMLWARFHFTLFFFFPFQLQVWKCFMLWDFWSFSKIAEVFQFCFYSWSLSLTSQSLYSPIFYCQVFFRREIFLKGLKWKSLSCVQLFVTPWTVQSMGLSRPEFWSGYPFPSPGDLPKIQIEPRSPTLQADSLPAEPLGKPEIPDSSAVKNLPAMQETQVQSLGQEDSLEKEMEVHSSILDWEIPLT